VGTSYAVFETRIRADLSDSSSPPLLSSADLDRHIDHAARDLSIVAPLDQLIVLPVASGSRSIDLTAIQQQYTIHRYVAVEWPTGQYPQEFVQFNVFGPTLTLLVEQAPDGTQPTANLYTTVSMVCGASESQSTIPGQHDDVLILGAAGYAAQELATRLMNTINVGGPVVWEHYLTLSQQLLANFADELTRLRLRRQVFSRRLYAPEYPPQGISQTEVYPPEQIYP
jgi:hypothetical protein